MGMFDGAGMQMMIANMVKMAAPDLIEKVEEFQKVVVAFKGQLDRIEANQAQILTALNAIAESENGRIGKAIEGRAGAACETGSGAGQSR